MKDCSRSEVTVAFSLLQKWLIEVFQMELVEARRLADEALVIQETEVADGFRSGNLVLARLATELEPSMLRLLVHELRVRAVAERQLAARLLKESSLSADDVVSEVRSALESETDPLVIGWLVTALGYTWSPAALPDLYALARHESSDVRVQVPDALSECAEAGFGQVGDSLLDLSRDEDHDVRWSAIYELAAWLPDASDERVRMRLADAATVDPVTEIRATAAGALGQDEHNQ